jgi:hypothetical protein
MVRAMIVTVLRATTNARYTPIVLSRVQLLRRLATYFQLLLAMAEN